MALWRWSVLKVWIHRVVDMPVPLLTSHQLEGVMVQGRNLGGWRPSGGLELTGEHKWWNIYSVGHDTLECQADSRNQSSSSACILILLTTVDKHSNVMLVYFSWENTQSSNVITTLQSHIWLHVGLHNFILPQEIKLRYTFYIKILTQSSYGLRCKYTCIATVL